MADMVPARTLSKQALQYTGRSFRGANGTTAWPPQAPQIAAWNSRGPSLDRARFATARHDGQRWGSLVNPLLAKKACSPAEKLNSSAQSRQVRLRSWYTLSRPSSLGRGDAKPPGLQCPNDGRSRKGDCGRAPGSSGPCPGLIAVKIRVPSRVFRRVPWRMGGLGTRLVAACEVFE